jgi:tetratricopeptide (TPR) repeat protein
MVHFNYGTPCSFRTSMVRQPTSCDPRIRIARWSAYFLFADLEAGKTEAATAADDQARRYLQNYAKWQTEWQKSQTTSGVNLRMRDVLNRDDVFDLDRRNKTTESALAGDSASQDMLVKARELYQAGRDDEALPELHRVVMIEPTNAEAYLLSGRINLRRSDQEAAIAALKTAIFWDPKLIDAHILLGKIFLERGDRGEARKYAQSAITIDPNNPEEVALQRQVTMSN